MKNRRFSHFHAEQVGLQHRDVGPGHIDWILHQKDVPPVESLLVAIDDIPGGVQEERLCPGVNVETVGIVRSVDLPQGRVHLILILMDQSNNLDPTYPYNL